MNAAAIQHLQQLGEEGTKRFSEWNASLFYAYCGTILPELWRQLPPGAERTFAGLSAMVQQGIGEGYIKGGPDVAPRNFLEFCLRDWLPDVLASLPAEKHLPLLARVWNLGEGLLREPEWVNAYVMSRIGELRGDRMPEDMLIDVLRPLMETASAARWEAPYRVTLLSLRQADDEFLPGEMQLAAPTVLVVSDRRRPVRLGIHLRRDGKSQVLGTFGPTSSFPDKPVDVPVAWEGSKARIGDIQVPLPFLAAPLRWALVQAGYLVASAVDSQKLWIVESAA
jgi:hypothetical protein